MLFYVCRSISLCRYTFILYTRLQSYESPRTFVAIPRKNLQDLMEYTKKQADSAEESWGQIIPSDML